MVTKEYVTRQEFTDEQKVNQTYRHKNNNDMQHIVLDTEESKKDILLLKQQDTFIIDKLNSIERIIQEHMPNEEKKMWNIYLALKDIQKTIDDRYSSILDMLEKKYVSKIELVPMSNDVSSMKDTDKWLVRLIIWAVILAILTYFLKS